MNFKEIIEKYNYDSALAEFLEQVYNELINYFGEEQRTIIHEAFLNCPIVNENCYTALKSRGFLDNISGKSLVNDGDLKRASGVYASNPQIIYNSNTNSYEILEVKRVVAIGDLKLNYEYIRAAIIHEIAHLVKGYYGEYSINGNILTEKCGLIERKYELSSDGGNVLKTNISETGVGLEEGLNSMVEEDIARKIINPEYKVSGYGTVTLVARQFTEIDDSLIKVIMAQFYKDKSELYETFGDDYYKLEEVVDKMYEYSLAQFAALFDSQKMRAISDEFNSYIINEYIPLMKKLKENSRKMG